jgi:mannose-1-phosphate guanylyltransferase/mannose-6-phosphate isomerase
LAALAALAGGTGDAESAAILLVMPAAHVIRDTDAFHVAISKGAQAAADGKLVTFGVVPTGPETGYGYIEAEVVAGGAAPIKAFVEKPDLETATAYVKGGKHFWNSGMFMFAASKYLEELGRHAPEMLAACQAAMLAADLNDEFVRPATEEFLACPGDSIDYAVMEKTDNAMVVPLDADWSDVGSWSVLHDVSARDADNNTISGDTLLHDCHDTHIHSEHHLVAAVGVHDLVIVETKDAVLVSSKTRSQEVKALVDKLNEADREETKFHRQVFRPWGNYDSIDSGDGFQVKRLIVNPGSRSVVTNASSSGRALDCRAWNRENHTERRCFRSRC